MAKKKAPGFLLERDQKTIVDELTNEEAGIIFKAIYEYETTREEPKLDKSLRIVFKQFKVKLDYYDGRYNEKCEQNRENIQNYWNKIKNTTEYDRIQSNTTATNKRKEKKRKENKSKENNNIYNNNNNIYDFVQENFGRTLNPIEYEEISSWEDNELTRYAIKQTILGGKYNIKYISRILESYKRENIATVQQAQERERQYSEAKKKHKKEYKTATERNNEVFQRFLAEGDE